MNRRADLPLNGRVILLSLVAAVSVAVSMGEVLRDISGSLRRYWDARSMGRAPRYDERIAGMVESSIAPDARLYVVRSPSQGMQAVENSRIQFLAWLQSPTPVLDGSPEEVGDVDAVLSPPARPTKPPFRGADVAPNGFEKIASVGFRELWIRKDRYAVRIAPGSNRNVPFASWCELIGLLPVAMVAVAGFWFGRWAGLALVLTLFSLSLTISPAAGIATDRTCVLAAVLISVLSVGGFRKILTVPPRHDKAEHRARHLSVVACIALFLLLSFLALSHSLLPPNGLAVVGGKAKLWYLSGGFPSGFFTDSAWRLTEPAYPPGMASLVLGCYAMAGGCGEWLTQLVGCAAMAVLLGAVLDGCCRTGEYGRFARVVAAIWILSLFLDPVPLKMGSLLYPEPLMALCVVIGWRRVWRDGRREDWMGWFLLGASGWFKNEGVVFAIAAWLVRLAFVVFFDRLPNRSKFQAAARLVSALAIALALPVAWHAGVRMAGGGLNDFAPLWQPEIMRGMKVLSYSFRLAILAPWHYAFAYPAIAIATGWSIAGIANKMRRRRTGSSTGLVVSDENRLHLDRNDCRVLRALFFALFCMVAFVWILACSRAPDFEWHVTTSIPRLLWTPALIIVLELASLDPPGNTEET